MKLKNDIVNLIVRVEHHLCPQYCGVVDRRRVIAFLLLTISELVIIPYHIMLFLLVKEPYGLSLCGLHTFVFCILQFLVWKRKIAFVKGISSPSNPQPIGFSGILLAKRQNSFYCTYFLHNRNVADTKSPYPIKRLEVIRWFNQKSMVFNQSLS